MIKGIFVGEVNQEKVNKVLRLGFNAVFLGYKNLEKGVARKFRGKGIKIYTEVGVFVGEGWWERYPDARPVNRSGKMMKKSNGYVGDCPNHPQVRKEKLQLIKKIVDSENLDGLWLDFIRYPCHWEVPHPDLTEYCFCSYCLKRFKQDTGIAQFIARQREMNFANPWVRWKCAQITNFVAEVRSLIRKSGKNVQLGMFSVPWKEEEFKGAIRKVIGQDFRGLARQIDIFSPMVYHKMCGRPTSWIHEIVVEMEERTEKPILPVIQTEDKPGKITPAEFKEAFDQAKRQPSRGVIIFFLEDLLKDKSKLKALQ